MKITASKVDDVLRRKTQYDTEKYEWDKENSYRRVQYKKAQDAVMNPVKSALEQKLAKFNALTFEVQVEPDWQASGDLEETLRVRIKCNDTYEARNSESRALVWDWEARIHKGEVEKKSSSWSGLQACTEDQLESLRQTVRALELLNDLDWEDLLNRQTPSWNEYFGDQPRQPKGEDWDSELAKAQIEDIIGTNQIIKVFTWGESCPFNGRFCWVQILGETPARFKIEAYSPWDVEHGGVRLGNGYLRQVKKESIRPVKPVEIQEVRQA